MYSRIWSGEVAWPSLTQATAAMILAGRAVAALQGVAIDEGLLHGMQFTFRRRQAFDRRDLGVRPPAPPASGKKRRGGLRHVRWQAPHCPWSQPFLAPVTRAVPATRRGEKSANRV